MSSTQQHTTRSRLTGAVAVVVWLGVWQLASWAIGNSLLLAGPLQTFMALCSLVGRGVFWLRIAWTFAHIAAGFLCAFVLACALAALASRSRVVEALLRPPMLVFKSTPVVCIVVLLLIWFGSRQVSFIAVLLVVLPAIYFSALEGIASLDHERLQMLELFGVSRLRRALVYVWPSLQPFLFATCKLVVGMSWKAGVAAELIGTPLGSIGERIYQAKILLETADLFAWTAVVVALAWLCERLFLQLLARSARWSQRVAIPRAGAAMQLAEVVAAPEELTFEAVSKSFAGHAVLQAFSLACAPGSRTALMGPSGIGKTTTLELAAQLERPDTGVLRAPAQISLGWQKTCLLEQLSPLDNISLVVGDSLSQAAIRALLLDVLPERTLAEPVSELSGGERRRVELVRALAAPAGLVLLDEPFASLDEASHEVCAAFVRKQLCGRTLVVATHDARDAELLDARVVHVG